jgi:aspartate aminotransferase-like enzyme
MAHVKLHIPGPVEVSAKTFQAMTQPMIGHRGQGFKDLYGRIQPQLQTLLSTQQRVYLSTSSAWGVMEGALTNLCTKKVLNCMCGAFSDKWFDVAKKLGKDAEALQVPWGSPIRAEQIDARLATGQFDALTLIHNETSTGTLSSLKRLLPIAAAAE